MKKSPVLVTFILLLLSYFVFAGTTGKIVGIITDSEYGDPLIGVNVIIEGTTLGAATDMDGYYVILNVPPGRYHLKAIMMGYGAVIFTDVRVNIDLTTSQDIKMTPTVVDLGEVVVVAERLVVQPDISASQMNIEAKTIESLPVLSIIEVVGLQAGVQGLTIRGGSDRQTAFIVDGFVLNDERSNVPYTSVSLNTVKEVQVQTGGFNAEYGNIRSGIINVVTREGSKDRYSGALTIRYRPPGKKHFGPSVYDPNTYFTRPYLDPEVCYTGTSSGAWDNFTQRQFPFFDGWNAISDATLKDDDPTNDLTPEGARRLWEWQHRRQGDIDKPDYTIDVGFGGPVPFISEKLGNLRFYTSYRDEQDMFIFPLSRDSYDENIARLKLTADLNPKMKLTFTGMYGEIYSVSPYQWKTTPTGGILRSSYGIANYVSSSSGNSIIYMPGWFSPSSIYRNILGINFNHVLSSRTYYEINIQNKINRYNTYKMADRDTTKNNEILPGYFVDEAPYGYWGYGVEGIDGMRIGGWMNLGRDKSVNSTTSFRFDFTSQVNNRNQVKTGLDIVYNDYDIKSFTESPSMSTWCRKQVYEVFPYRIGAYVQDKLEFEGFIANVGVRLDYSHANSSSYKLEPYDDYFKAGKGDSIETVVPSEKATPQWGLSPRFGVAHPITENSKLYFNYGHYIQEPASSYRFRIQREYSGLVTSIGEPNLESEKTVAYELGYSHNLFNQFLLNIAAYYKDVTNQHGWVYYQNINNSVQYSRAVSNNYEDIRGFEVTLTKRVGGWITGFVNYTYDVRTSGYFGLTEYWEDPNKQRDYLRLNPYQERPHPQPYARVNIDFHTPLDFGPDLMKIYPIGGWNLNVLATWDAGSYVTYNPNQIPGVVNNVQWKDRHNVDLRLIKTIKMKNNEIQFFVDFTNLLNTKFLSYSSFSDNFDYLDYMGSLHFDWEEGTEHGSDRVGEYRDWDVEYVPMQTVPDINNIGEPETRVLYYDQATDKYMQYKNENWVERGNSWVKKEVLDNKAYIDMPNLTYFTFLNPRGIKFGLKVIF